MPLNLTNADQKKMKKLLQTMGSTTEMYLKILSKTLEAEGTLDLDPKLGPQQNSPESKSDLREQLMRYGMHHAFECVRLQEDGRVVKGAYWVHRKLHSAELLFLNTWCPDYSSDMHDVPAHLEGVRRVLWIYCMTVLCRPDHVPGTNSKEGVLLSSATLVGEMTMLTHSGATSARHFDICSAVRTRTDQDGKHLIEPSREFQAAMWSHTPFLSL